MKEDHFIPLPDWFFDMSILSWIGLNYLVFYISKSIPLTVVSGVLCLISLIVIIRNKRYIRDYTCYMGMVSVVTGYWFLVVAIITVLLQIKSKTAVWSYALEAIVCVVIFVCTKKPEKSNTGRKEPIDFEEAKKAPKRSMMISACIMALFSLIHISMSENQVFFILSLLLLALDLFVFWLFSMSITRYSNKLNNHNTE